jgi:type IV pilus assembly protein PilN
MIHINLLPVGKSKKQEAGRQQLVVMVGVIILAVGGNYFGYSKRDNAKQDRDKRIAQTKLDIANLDKVIGEVKDITQRTKDLEDKMAVLTNLKRNRSGPVKVLDAIQTALPKKVWIRSAGETGGAMSIAGQAFSHDDLAEFMSTLQNIVDTPLGIGKVVESNQAGISRVELADGSVKDFKNGEVNSFFTNVSLKGAKESDLSGFKIVDFNLTLSANYAA